MRIDLGCGLENLGLDIPEANLVQVRRQPLAAPLSDPVRAVKDALEKPLEFPALRRALIPDDHVTIVVDEQLPDVGRLIMPILEHIRLANVSPEAVTILCPPSSVDQPWLEDLSDEFLETRLEVHDPDSRQHLSYLATTRRGRRIYLNRTLVDADQVVVLTGRGYDPLLGYSGAEGAIFPALSDQATRRDILDKLNMAAPGDVPWPLQQEAAEVAWHLGAPFLVQVIVGADSEILHVLGGLMESSKTGQRLLDSRWRVEVDRTADVVVAGVGGNPDRQTFADLARALACASRVVRPRGRIVLVTNAQPDLGREGEFLRQTKNAAEALKLLKQIRPSDIEAVFQWASAAQQASLFLLSKLPASTAEELFAVPVDDLGQVQDMVKGEACLLLPDAHKTMAVLRKKRDG